MALATAFDLDVGYTADRTPLTVIIPVKASKHEIEEIKEMMVKAFARTENVPEAVMRTLMDELCFHTTSATHHYIQWTRVHAKEDEMYASRLMENIRAVRQTH
jgi:GTP-binding protein EngB required for normal cell division